MNFQARQGDVLIEKVSRLPSRARRQSGLLLALGEATGHAHRLDGGILYQKGADLYFRAPVPVTLWHDEHGPIPIPPGIYRVRRQREYMPQDQRWVAD